MLKHIHRHINLITNDKLFIGLIVIFINIASKYININLSKNQELLLKKISSEILVFFIAFIGTRDFFVSLFLTLIYWIFVNILFNEKSQYCILPNHMKELYKIIDTNKDGILSKEEIEQASRTLKLAQKQGVNINHFDLINNLN